MPGRLDIESSLLPAKCMLKAIEVSVTPKGTDPHGRLSDGVLRVTGKVQVADARSANPLQWESQRTKEHLLAGGGSVGWAIYDCQYDAVTDGARTVYVMTSKIRPEREMCYCLLLVTTGTVDEFRRVGMGPTGTGDWDSLGSLWFNDVDERRVTMI
jgi:hypothetical protein